MYRIVLAGLLPALFVAPAAAQPRGDVVIVTEAEFLSALDDSHPAVAEGSEALALARARIVAASTLENPVLEAVREDLSGPTSQIDWTLSWQLPGADRRSTIAAREGAADAAAVRLQQQLLGLRLMMKQVYADWALAAARHELLDAQAERIEALADRERLRAERGEASGLEAGRIGLAASGLRARVALAAASAERAKAKAAGWSSVPWTDARPALPAPPTAPELSEDHPLLRAAARDLATAMLEREAAGRFLKSPEVSLGWQRQEAGPVSIDGPTIGLAWSVPVFARNRGEKAASEARIVGARARLQRVRREIEAGRVGAQASFQRLMIALRNAEAALDAHERMLEGIEAAFRHGEASLTDLLETYRSVTESELSVLDLHEGVLATHRELERVAGHAAAPNVPGSSPESTPKESLP